jgi:hypothetical protein
MRRTHLPVSRLTPGLPSPARNVGYTKAHALADIPEPIGTINTSKSIDGSSHDSSDHSNQVKRSTMNVRERVALTRSTSRAFETTTTLTSQPRPTVTVGQILGCVKQSLEEMLLSQSSNTQFLFRPPTVRPTR